MRHAITIAFGIALALVDGCTSQRAASTISRERRTVAGSGSAATVVCELRYYVLGTKPPPLRVLRNDGKSLTCALSDPYKLLKHADTNLMFDVGGFVLQIIEPKQYAGQVLTAHFDGPLASGDPFKAFAFGKRYQMDVPEKWVGDTNFWICY